jgi:Glutamine synthetase, catalytic domain
MSEGGFGEARSRVSSRMCFAIREGDLAIVGVRVGVLGGAIAQLERDEVLLEALGAEFATAYLAVRKAEWEAMKHWKLEEEVQLLLERY